MALRFIDSFDHYTSIPSKWSTARLNAAGVGAWGRNSTRGLSMAGVSAFPDYIQKNLPSAQATIIVGVAYKFEATPASHVDAESPCPGIIILRDGTTSQLYVEVTSIGRLRVCRGDGTVLATGTTDLMAGVYYYFELKATINNTTGSFTLRIDEVTEVTGSNVDTQNTANATADNVLISSAITSDSVANYVYIDDVYIADGSAGQITDFAGDCRVECLFPNGPGAHTDFLPSTGLNWQNVDDAPAPDDDATYNASLAANNIDTYAFTNLTATTGSVKGVQTVIDARKDDSGTRTLAPVIRQTATDYVGSTVAAQTSYALKMQVYELNPATSVAFTISEVNADEFGVKQIA